jgi:hypothetical protein
MDKLKTKYLEEAERIKGLVEKKSRSLLILSFLRLAVFIAGIILTWIGFTRGPAAGISILIVSTVLFLFLLRRFAGYSVEKTFLENFRKVNLNEASALAGDFSSFDKGEKYMDREHSFSFDIDLFGEGSLFQFLNRTVTGYGRDILADWLKDPYELAQVLHERQEVIKELSGKLTWRQRFLAAGMNKPLERADVENFSDWLREERSVRSDFKHLMLIYVLPSLAMISLLGALAGILSYTLFTYVCLFNLFIVASGLKTTNSLHRSVTGMHNYLTSLRQLISIFENESFSSEILAEIGKNIAGGKVSAAVALNRMEKVLQAFDSRLNLLAGFFLNGLFLWDYQCIRRLNDWKEEYRDSFPEWLAMTGKIDAFVSLANFAYNNAEFCYPEKARDGRVISFRHGGHPLIGGYQRICNDFEIRKSGQVCIVTGANMAGKSTFLRTVAVNYILAMTGAPVCAASMVFSPVKLFTSMRTTDSLSGNESYFYAELKRLRQLKSRLETREPVFFILDEILKGTNSADKSLGSHMFLKKLTILGGTGMIATHDISLGDLEKEFPGTIFNMCFEVEIEGESISFDYILRNGITRKMNAAILMKQMGILD